MQTMTQKGFKVKLKKWCNTRHKEGNKIGHMKGYRIGHKQGCKNGHQNEDSKNGVKLG